jgi:formylglycine-generating enzyme required for sulfatase activity
MGSKISSDEKLDLNQELDYDYWISRYPVTNAQFVIFVNDGGYNDSAYWVEAKQAGVWQEGRMKGWLDSHEAEWEKAARGGERIPERFVIGAPWEMEHEQGVESNNNITLYNIFNDYP